MKKPTLTAMLSAGLMTVAGVAYADEPKLNVQKTSDDKAIVTIDQAQSSKMSGQTRVQQDQKIRGTVVSLETFLRDGEQAARQEKAASAGMEQPKALIADNGDVYVVLGMANAGRSASAADADLSSSRTGSSVTSSSTSSAGSMDRSASASAGLDSDDKLKTDLEVRDGQPTNRDNNAAIRSTDADIDADTDASASAKIDTDSSTMGMNAGEGSTVGQPANVDDNTIAADPDAEDPQKLRNSPGYELNTEGDSDASARVDVDVDRSADASATISTDVDAADKKNAAPGRERHTHKADMSARDESQTGAAVVDLDSDAQRQSRLETQSQSRSTDADARTSSDVYGYASPSQDLRVGQQVSVTGDIYERDGMKGIEISNVSRQ